MSTFTPPADIAQITLAKSSDVNAIKAATAIAFGLLPDENKLKRGTVNYAVDTGTANTYVVALDASITSYTDGLQIVFRPINSNTGTATINLNGLGAKSIVLTNSDPIQAGDINAGAIIDVRYSTSTGFFHLTPNSAIYAHDAGVSADAAAASASAASSSASAASSSASAASSSASAASSSASSASSSASNAASSASTATTQAGIATTQASLATTNGATQVALATTQATNASASATTATTQAGIATTQASIATTQAANASTSATTATTQAGIATTQATNAASSATAAAASYDSFDDRYLGSKVSDPTLDNDGNALLTGALYWNSPANVMKVYNGGAWSVAYVSASSTGASIRPSLLLDFANSKTLDPRITFTRESTATYTGADGLIKNAASGEARFDHNPTTGASLGLLIEEARTNLLTYSERGVVNPVRAYRALNAAIAPDGTMSAFKLIQDTTAGNADHFIGFGIVSSTTANTVNTASIYVKAGEMSKFTLDICDSTDYVTTRLRADVDLNNVRSVITVGTGTTTIAPVGNGWFRVSVTGQAKNGSSGAVDVILTLENDAGSISFNGDGKSGLYLWGAQLEQGAFPTSYIPSADSFTSRASTGTFIGSNGLIQTAATNVARYNYNPLNLALAPKLLLEPASTNLLTYSEQFDNAAWGKSNATVTANSITAPDGTLTADKLVENTATSTHHTVSLAITVAASPHTVSAFIKTGELNTVRLMFRDAVTANYVYADFDSTSLTPPTVYQVGTTFSAISSTITDVGNSWKRITITARPSVTSVNMWLSLVKGGTGSYTGDGTSGIYIWGVQLETGNTATSYIPTTSAQVTRAADVSSSAQATRAADNAVMTGANFSSWYRQDEGTVFAKADSNLTTALNVVHIDDGTSNNRIALQTVTNSEQFVITTGGVNQAQILPLGSVSSTNNNLLIGSYALNNAGAASNGNPATVDTSCSIPTVSNLRLGGNQSTTQLNGHIAKLAYYPKRLSNAELQSITTG